MKINLKEYMTVRDSMKERKGTPGPIVTISRQYGCEANPIARLLIRKLDEQVSSTKWKMVSKEIIDESASVLRLTPARLEQRVIDDALSTIEDMFSSLSHHYSMTDKKITETVKNIIETYAHKGHVVMIGRGSTSLTQKKKNAIHVRLMAPDSWRVRKIMEKSALTEKNAFTLIQKVDHDRLLWSEHLSNTPFNDGLFDVVFNRMRLTEDEIVDTIIRLMKGRKLI